MDWDKLKVFHAAAEAGSFTHAGEQLGLSQSAVSRQVSALEQELGVSLFHRHARGLILTEQGELLHHTAHDVFMKLEAARAKLTDSKERPNGELKVQTTPGIGVHWLTPRLGEFIDLYPDIHITLITTDEELDLAMREADVAIRLRQPTQPDLIQRKLFSVRFHAYASPDYLKRFGTPKTLEELDEHRVLMLGGSVVPNHFENRRWLIEVSRNGKGPRTPVLTINTVLGVMRACQRGIGVALLPDYLVEENGGLVQLFGEFELDRARRLFRLSGGTEVGRARAGLPRFPGGQGAALALLSSTHSATFAAATQSPAATPAWLTCDPLYCLDEMPGCILHTLSAVRLPILPDCNRQAGSCSPLEGDCRPPRRQTEAGPARVRFLFAPVDRAGAAQPHGCVRGSAALRGGASRISLLSSFTNLGKTTMAWTTPTLVEICLGLEINGYLPAEF